MKRRILTISLVVAAVVLLITVGFAGWEITQSTTGNIESNFQAYGVTDSGSLEVLKGTYSGSNFTPGSPTIIFGKPNPIGSPTYDWLSQTDVADQNLSVWIKLVYKGPANSFSLEDSYTRGSAGSAVAKSDVNKLIAGPTYHYEGIPTNASLSGSIVSFTGDGEIIIKVTYGWAKVFNNDSADSSTNPYTYFNSKQASAHITSDDVTNASNAGVLHGSDAFTTDNTYAQLAADALTALDNLITVNSVKLYFKITVTKQ